MKFSHNMEKLITNTRINSTNFNLIKEFKETQNRPKYTLIISNYIKYHTSPL
jgi:hypothetical protein